MPRPVASFILHPSSFPRRALTLAELVVVMGVLAVLAGLVLPAVGHYMGESRDTVTRQSLTRLRDVLALYWSDKQTLPRPDATVAPARATHPQVRYLFVNPLTENATLDYDPVYRRGWRGPYVVHQQNALYAIDSSREFTNLYGETGDPTVLDGWGHALVIQHPGVTTDGLQDIRIVSAGPDGVLNIPPATSTQTLTAADIGDDLWVTLEVR
jgi:type II secretory pathway pseudopilin PulG